MRCLESGTGGGVGGGTGTGTGLLSALLAFIMALSLVDGLKCLSCRGQNVFECYMSAEERICEKGEECRFRKLHSYFLPSRKKAWVEAGCATQEQCSADDIYYWQFCCRFSYCNYFPTYMKK